MQRGHFKLLATIYMQKQSQILGVRLVGYWGYYYYYYYWLLDTACMYSGNHIKVWYGRMNVIT